MKAVLPFVLIAALATISGPALANPATLSAINAERTAKGRAPLVWNDRLSAAARAHARDMSTHGYFSHTAPDGAGLVDRIRRQGYCYRFAAENIARGQTSLAEVMQSWMKSRGHRRNILDRRAREVGVAQAPDRTWVMVLGAGC